MYAKQEKHLTIKQLCNKSDLAEGLDFSHAGGNALWVVVFARGSLAHFGPTEISQQRVRGLPQKIWYDIHLPERMNHNYVSA